MRAMSNAVNNTASIASATASVLGRMFFTFEQRMEISG